MNAIAREELSRFYDFETGLRKTAQALFRSATPALMEVQNLYADDIEAVRKGLWQFDNELSRQEQETWALHVVRDPEYDEPDDGAIRKQGTDWKIFFHYRADLEAMLLTKRGITLTQWQREWFRHMHRLLSACNRTTQRLVQRLDKLYPGHRFEQRYLATEHLNVLRTLKYVPRAGVLAKLHTDRCGITFHIAESASGLKVESEMPLESPQAPHVLVFPGDQFTRITGGKVPACRHTVVDTTGGTEERFAMVYFAKFNMEGLPRL
jgi:hypothetical protein